MEEHASSSFHRVSCKLRVSMTSQDSCGGVLSGFVYFVLNVREGGKGQVDLIIGPSIARNTQAKIMTVTFC